MLSETKILATYILPVRIKFISTSIKDPRAFPMSLKEFKFQNYHGKPENRTHIGITSKFIVSASNISVQDLKSMGVRPKLHGF